MFRIDFAELTGGATIMVYGQQEVMKDLGEGADARGLQIIYNAEEVKPQALDSDTPFVTYVKDGKANRIDSDFVVGCDGYHGVARQSIPARGRENLRTRFSVRMAWHSRGRAARQ
ncbi:MAG: FAD-dependent monooxygenase [Alphaproteobacteria bacterium]